jgi:hypothetical protein
LRGGLLAALVGAALVVLSPGPDASRRFYYRTWPWGVGVLGAGLGFMALGMRARRSAEPADAGVFLDPAMIDDDEIDLQAVPSAELDALVSSLPAHHCLACGLPLSAGHAPGCAVRT